MYRSSLKPWGKKRRKRRRHLSFFASIGLDTPKRKHVRRQPECTEVWCRRMLRNSRQPQPWPNPGPGLLVRIRASPATQTFAHDTTSNTYRAVSWRRTNCRKGTMIQDSRRTIMEISDDVFLSYSRDDKERLREIFSTLHENTWFRIWWDKDLRAGQSFPEKIDDALRAA